MKITNVGRIVGLNRVPIGKPLSVMSIIEWKLKPLFIGEDPLCPERLWDKMQMEMRRDHSGSASCAISDVDVAR